MEPTYPEDEPVPASLSSVVPVRNEPHDELFAQAKSEEMNNAAAGVAYPGANPGKHSLWAMPKMLSNRVRFWWSQLLFPSSISIAIDVGREFWGGLAVLCLLAGWLLFGNLSYPLVEPDEGRYAEVARKMLASGDWIVPMLNHRPFYDKPPLFYWLAAASYHWFGTSGFAARLVSALAAFLTVLATYLLGRRLVGTRSAFLGGVALVLMPEFLLCGRIIILDSLLTFFVAVALFAACLAVEGRRISWFWWIVSALSCALGILAKGPVAFVLLGPPVAAYLWLNRDKARVTLKHAGAYLGLLLVLVSPWYIAIIIRDPSFAYHFFIEEHLGRFFVHGYHERPFWYYGPVLLVACFPWSVLIVPFSRFLWSQSATVRAQRLQSLGFLLLWGGWCIGIFSLCSGKLPPYILPAMPPIALLVGYILDRALFEPSLADVLKHIRGAVPRLTGIIAAAVLLVVSVGGWHIGLISPVAALLQSGLFAGCLLALVVWGGRLPAKRAWLLCSALAALLLVEIGHELLPAWALRRSPLLRYEVIAASVRDGQTPVLCQGAEWGSIPFYLNRDDIVVNLDDVSLDELRGLLGPCAGFVLISRHKGELETVCHRAAPRSRITKVLNADEIGVAFVETDPSSKQ